MKLWITYAWKDNNDGDFDYLVQELQKVGIESAFDRVELIPGRRLWQQIGDKIMNGEIDGWAYLVTPTSLNSDPCKEELEYALARFIEGKSNAFPLIGLLHGVSVKDVPPALKVRLCINLASANWREEVKAAIQNRAPVVNVERQDQFKFEAFQKNVGSKKTFILQFHPRFENIQFWRIAVPDTSKIFRWGSGPADGSDSISGVKHHMVEGIDTINGTPVVFKGTGDALSANVAAKIIIEDELPGFVAFSVCKEPFEVPKDYSLYTLNLE